jgi:hypothetical protein
VPVAALVERRETGTAAADRVRVVRDWRDVDAMLAVPVTLVMVHFGQRAVDRDLPEVRAAEPDQLRVEVREVAGLQ